MCGIFGYSGKQKAHLILISGLQALEYRGYDSCGIVLSGGGDLFVKKQQGRIFGLKKALSKIKVPGHKIGIAHTRWATHGSPNKVNAHPHLDCSKKIAVVHNGIIENYDQLKEKLLKKYFKTKFRELSSIRQIVFLIWTFLYDIL